ncbi:MAG: hypothetical protein ACYTFG_17045, partial [Planctomycetota bacterium]
MRARDTFPMSMIQVLLLAALLIGGCSGAAKKFEEAKATADLEQKVEKLKAFLTEYPDHEEAKTALAQAEDELKDNRFTEAEAAEG